MKTDFIECDQNWAEEKTCEGVVQEEWDEFVKYARETEESEK